MNFFLGLIGVAIGFMMVWKADWIVNNFGRIDWAEVHLGADGGSRLMWKLIGLAVIFFSLMYATGLLGNFVLSVFGSLFGGYRK